MYTPGDTLPLQLSAVQCCLSSPLSMAEVMASLDENHFSDERILGLITGIREMALAGYQINPQSLATYMEAEKGFDASDVISEAMAAPPASPKFIVKSLTAIRGRQLASELGQYLSSEQAAKDGIGEILSRINKFSLTYSAMSTERVIPLSEFMANIDKPGDRPLIILPGLGEIDKHYRFRPGTFNVVGAPPGVGKTALLLNMAVNATYQGHNVLTISLEVPDFDLKARATAMIAGVSAFRAKEKTLFQVEIDQVRAVAHSEADKIARFHSIAPAKMQVDAVQAEIQKWMSSHDIKMVHIDYLQRLQAPSRYKSEYERVTYASETLTAVAKTTGIPIVCASATKRIGNGEDHSMHSLKSSGQIEFDGHTIAMLSRDKENRHIMFLDLVKNRDGGLFGANLYYDFETQRITEDQPKPFSPVK